ncbi:hypothetical protein [Zoogloea sp.]|uniref:hypothetical protein n=1 Tax=Zoogloea sp. TaxID=49181 RepID=UPI0035AEBC88
MERKPARRHTPDSLFLLLAVLALPRSGLTAPFPATQAEGRYIWKALPERALITPTAPMARRLSTSWGNSKRCMPAPTGSASPTSF